MIRSTFGGRTTGAAGAASGAVAAAATTVGSGTGGRASGGGAVRSRHGLILRPEAATASVHADLGLPSPEPAAAARTVDRELAHIAARYDRPTAELVALILEYPWPTQGSTSAGRSDT